jgi:hypothetical protein
MSNDHRVSAVGVAVVVLVVVVVPIIARVPSLS